MHDLITSAPAVQPDLAFDPISEADRLWWASVSSSEWWHDLAADRVADAYGTLDPFDRDDDDAIIDRHLSNHGYSPDPPDEFFRYGGYPT